MPSPPSPVSPPDSSPTRERLRAVASELFGRRGYSGTSMSEIAARVGIRKASLYNYFAAKEELLLDLFEEGLAAWRDASGPALEGPGNLEARLEAHLRGALAFALRHPHRAAIIRVAATQIGGDLGRRVRERLAAQRGEYLASLEGHFSRAMAAGEIPPAEPLDLALAVRAFLDGLLTNLLFRAPDAGRFQERFAELWAILWRGLSGRQPAARAE